MPKYIVSGYLTVSVCAEVDAASPDEAKEKAMGLGAPSLCHHCSEAGGDHDTWQINGGLDGCPPDDCVQDVTEADDDDE